MTAVAIYDEGGIQVSSARLPGKELRHVKGRLSYCESSGVYYKGAGCPYRSHFTNAPLGDERTVARLTIPYIKREVVFGGYEGKSGIFMRPYQPQFTDPIGGCGPKEKKVMTNSTFRLSSPRVVEVYPITDEFAIYAIRYTSGRRPFDGNVDLGLRLMAVMLRDGWCWPWDKNAVGDINDAGLVTDVADIFRSDHPAHRMGTAYSYLYSLHQAMPEQYAKTAARFGETGGLWKLPTVALKILREANRANGIESDDYHVLVYHYIMGGTTCAGLQSPDLDSAARAEYRRRFVERLPGVVIAKIEACTTSTPSPILSASPGF